MFLNIKNIILSVRDVKRYYGHSKLSSLPFYFVGDKAVTSNISYIRDLLDKRVKSDVMMFLIDKEKINLE